MKTTFVSYLPFFKLGLIFVFVGCQLIFLEAQQDTIYTNEDLVLLDAVSNWERDTAYASGLLREADILFNEKKYQETLLKLDSAGHIIVTTEGDSVEKYGAIVRKEALAFEHQFLYDTAIILYRKAISIQITSLGLEHPVVAKTYSDIALCLQAVGDYSQAEEYLKKSLGIFLVTFGSESAEIATVYKNFGVNKYLVGNYSQAIEYTEKSLIIELNRPDTPQLGIAQSYDNLGAFHYLKGDYNKGIEWIKKSLAIRLKILGPDDLYVAQSYSNMGACLTGKGDFDAAIEYFEKALAILSKAFGADHPYLASPYNNLGSCHYLLGYFDTAIEFHEKALAIRLKILGEDHVDVAGIIENLGNCFQAQGNHLQAIENFNKALAIGVKTFGLKHPYVAQSHHNLASCYLDMKNFELAIENYQKALTIWSADLSEKHPHLVSVNNALGDCFIKKGDYDQAMDYFQKALIANNYKKGTDQPALSNEFLLQTLKFIGFIYLIPTENKNVPLAISTYNEAHQALDHYRKSLSATASKERLSSKFLYVHEGSIFANFISYQKTGSKTNLRETFNFAEQSKSLSLLEAFKEADAQRIAGMDTILLEKERQLQVDLAYLERKRFEEETKPAKERQDSIVAALGAKVFDKRQQLDSLLTFFEEEYSEYKRLKYDLSTVSLDFVQNKLLNEGQTLLEYFVGDSSIFIFVVKKDDYQVREVKKDFPLKEWVEQMRAGIQSREKQRMKTSEIRQGLQAYATAAHQLYQKLISPVESLLDDNLIIVPDGELGYLPFEALLTAFPTEIATSRNYPFLIKDKTISYAQSATLLAEMINKQHHKQPEKAFLSLGPFSHSDRILAPEELEVFATRGDTLSFLKNSHREVVESAAIFEGDSLLADQATLGKFQTLASNYRILLLSTHGKGDKNLGDYSWLAFAKADEIYNLLYVRDLYALKLNADLVVLSACETNYGELRRGEGIVGMARAFAYAGAKSLFATLWSVEDKASSDLTLAFFRQLKSGEMTKDQALREAKLRLLQNDDTAHPYYWAGFIAIGDMAPVELGVGYKVWSLWTLVVFIGVGVFGLLLWRFGRRHGR